MVKKIADRRSKLEINMDILKSLARSGEPVRPTQILRMANLSWKLLGELIGPLLASEVVKSVELHKPEGTGYALTPKGNQVLNLYTDFLTLLRSNEVVAYPADQGFKTLF